MNQSFLKKLVLSVSFFCFTLLATSQQKFSTAGFFEVENSPRKVFNFNVGWRFYKGDVKGAHEVSFDDSNWEATNVPHSLEILPENASGGRNYQGVAWYRKEFSNEKINLEGKVFLYFEAVMGVAKVWVNGTQVAEHYGGYLPFAADISSLLNKNGKNIVAVMADNSNSGLYPPGKEQSGLDFTYFGGIYRDAFLINTNPIHVTLTELSKTVAGGNVFVGTLDIKDKDATIGIRTEIANDTKNTQNIIVKSVLENADYIEIDSVKTTIKLASGKSKQLSKNMRVKNAHFWHPEGPYLHFIRTDIIANGKIVDQLRTRFGIRLFEMKGPEGLFVNKKYIGKKLIGVNRHQDYAYVGNALPNSSHYRDVKLLREGGSHIIRAGHYPQDDAFYDACDELGMLTTTANPGWHFFNFKEKIFEDRLYEDSHNLVRKDRNRASVLLWETAINETPYQPDYAMHNMHLAAHSEYPYPGMFTVTDYDEAIKAGIDVYYHGNDKTINSFNREFGDGGEVDNWYAQNSVVRVKREWGEIAMLNQSLRQAKYLAERFKTDKVRIGGAMWAGIDHQRGYHVDPFWGGHLNVVRLPRYTYYLYQSQNSPDYKLDDIKTGPMIYNTNELTQISPTDVVIYSNCDEINLTWMDKDFGTQKPTTDPMYAGLPHPPFIFKNVFNLDEVRSRGRDAYFKKQMIAEGFINGTSVIKDVKNYPQRTEKLKLSIADEGLDLIADGSDYVPIRATIVDSKGVMKVLAEEQVYFEVDGPAMVIGGIQNQGNPVKSSFGVATALIRATNQSGKITVRAFVKGLKSDEITFESKPALLSLLFSDNYVTTSKTTDKNNVIIEQINNEALPSDVKQLQKELEELKLELVGKNQALMELRSNPKK